MIAVGKRMPAWSCVCALMLFALPAAAQMRITEFMYSGSNGEFVEFTNVGSSPVDMTGWSFDDDSETPGSTPLSAYGVVAPGESVLLTDVDAETFRTAWNLCSGIKIVGANPSGLGRNDEINLYDADGTLVDRLTFGDQTFPGTIRTQNVSGIVSAAGLGANVIADWSFSAVGDADDSVASSGGDIGSPGHSTHATVVFDPCHTAVGRMRISEYLYSGGSGEYVEFTNVGDAPVDMSGWSYSDSARNPGDVSLSAFGAVAPGESVILTEATAAAFRTSWSLCDAAKVIGGNTTDNLGRNDEINLYDAGGELVDRLTYGDQDFPGSIRTQNASGWADASSLGLNTIADWMLSTAGDAQGSTVSAEGDVGSPARNAQSPTPLDPCPALPAPMRITEFMYSGSDGEFVEFTNVGSEPIDMSGWSFDDDSEVPGSVDLGGFGAVQPGESVILTDSDPAAFRSAWGLCDGYKVIGGNPAGLGNGDEINLYDADDALIDRLAYPHDGPPYTNGTSAWVPAAALGLDDASQWVLSTPGDVEGSITSTGGSIGRPGHSDRATVDYDPCAGAPDLPTVSVDPATTSPRLDLAASTSGAASGVIGDPTDPAATTGIGFTFALPGGGDASTLTIAATSDNPDVVDAAGLALGGSGGTRQLTITPHGVGYATITVSATDEADHTGTYTIRYAASAAAAQLPATRFHTGASDASATVALDDDTMLVADDETNVLRLYRRHDSGLPLAGFDFSADLNLTDPDNPEMDLEGSARLGDQVYWTGSYSNSKNAHVRPNRHRVFATTLAGEGADATLSYAGRYDWLLEDLVAWDHDNGHGLGADYLGFAASSAEGVDPKTPAGFNIEGLAIAPDNSTAYFAFRAPLLPTTDRHQAVIVPVPDFAALVGGAAPDSLPQGSATFGAPIFLDLGGRGIRSIDRNAIGQYLIIAGPPGDASGIEPADFRLYAWTGQPGDAPFDLGVDMTSLDVNGGSFESIAEVPPALDANSVLQFLFDNGNSVWYGDGIAAKDLAESRFKKAASLEVAVYVAFPPAAIAAGGGSPQSATVGEAFAVPLAVRVTDAYGHGVAGVGVSFAAPTDGASATLSATTASTDTNGDASVIATANTIAGAYTVNASLKGIGSVDFALTNLAGAAATVSATGGTPQTATVGDAFTAPLAVHVTDADGNAVTGATVTFSAPADGVSAALSATTATTDANGDASITATANTVAGAFAVTAAIDGVEASANFELTNRPGVAAAVTASSGTPQSAIVNQPFAAPLVVHVTDAYGNAIAGETALFSAPADSASAVLSSIAATTDANGDASITVTANGIEGSYTVSAHVNHLATPATFALTNLIDSSDRIFRDGFDPLTH